MNKYALLSHVPLILKKIRQYYQLFSYVVNSMHEVSNVIRAYITSHASLASDCFILSISVFSVFFCFSTITHGNCDGDV
jgi:hypothetical protein